MTPVLRIDNLHLGLHQHRSRSIPPQAILRGVDLTLHAGQAHGLVGESGAGKTMVARAILGITPSNAVIDRGRIEFQGKRLTERRRRRRLGRDIALIPQDPLSALNPVRRIGAQITEVLRRHLGLTRRQAQTQALELLDAVRLPDPDSLARRFPFQLSGGQRQRVLIAIAFACRPALIIADEPTTALDVTVQREILRLITALQHERGTALLFVSHDLGVIAKVCDEVSVMHGGRILEQAPAGQLFNRPRHPYTRALLAATPRHDRPAEVPRPVAAELTQRLWQECETYDRER